jgi:hypothetical protein
MIFSILGTTSYAVEYSSILFHYFRGVEEHLEVFSEDLRSTSFYIQPGLELSGSSGRIGSAVQKS